MNVTDIICTSCEHIYIRHHEFPTNCTPPAITQFPAGLFTQYQREHGAVLLDILVAIYMFLALSLVSWYYFVPACERICELTGMSPDVAGATIMAAGNSAPVLATTCIGVFVIKDDIGISAVLGSSVFNIILVVGLCALFAREVLYLSWWPMVRDSFFYIISISILIGTMYDSKVHWYEALLMVLSYCGYIIFMHFNTPISDKITPVVNKWTNCAQATDEESTPLKAGSDIENIRDKSAYNGHKSNTGNSEEILAEQDTPVWVLQYPDSCGQRVLWLFTLPLILLMFITIPDCRQERWRNWCVVTFVVSLFWIAGSTYVLVWMVTVIGFTLGIPDGVMGLTFLALAASLPDLITSVIVTRQGLGDMGVANAIASNVFDILFCLGIPWFFQTAVVSPGSLVYIHSTGLKLSAVGLYATVIIMLIVSHINKWRLTKPYGGFLMFVFVVFITLGILSQLNMFGYMQRPECHFVY